MIRFFIFTLFLFSNVAIAENQYRSNYSGHINQEIKSLTAEEIEGLKTGKGMGLAKAAELNGVPGPRHLLDLRVEIGLTEEQIQHIQLLFDKMKEKAIELGHLLIMSEKRLNHAFYYRHINKLRLKKMLEVNSIIRMELRNVHLATHLDTLNIVTDEQIELYNQLRGYNDSDITGSTQNHNHSGNHP